MKKPVHELDPFGELARIFVLHGKKEGRGIERAYGRGVRNVRMKMALKGDV